MEIGNDHKTYYYSMAQVQIDKDGQDGQDGTNSIIGYVCALSAQRVPYHYRDRRQKNTFIPRLWENPLSLYI